MNKGNFEKVSVILGPCDLPHMYELFEGYLIKDRYVMMIDNSVLTLRHVKKERHHSHLYFDGDTGGITLARYVQREDIDVITELVERLRNMDALSFLTDELLWNTCREDIDFDLVRNKGL
ncbi:hypothetical protein MKY98_24415 [Paenibacillus sp. FSL M8-0228]|uniref:hypothetical protein n=1 Tax=Paenibacillus TaxID=44249 RepID=UPI00083E4C8A|nr:MULTISPECIES: hypothetical protein [Paenibacillus]MBO3285182.1 hypothetical protein [Paenibacillus polymyxa]MBP1307927.1 hypothetical protein [Paenibacillus sp. 1182]ODB60778.1 hypothetical protein A7311_10505 [Paenibacillus polymyxa]